MGAAALLLPAFTGLGALLLVTVMAGAVATHLFVIGGTPVHAGVLLILAAIIAWGRRDRTLRIIGNFVPRQPRDEH